MSLLSSRREQKRFAKFAIVGATGTVVDYLIFNLAAFLFGLPEIFAQGISFVAAVTSNFIFNRNWTFRDSRSKRLRVQLSQYLLVNLLGLLIRTPIFATLASALHAAMDHLQLPLGISASWLAHNLALAGAIGVVMLWNYIINRRWTFGDV
ncbi:MAG: GtrA family protein [Anaerolineales bacterium]|nr:GtrA family protein [Anaerolineales bacterium]